MSGHIGCADDCTHPDHRERPLILGLVGPSGGGKTTVCERLANAHGFLRVHVAQPLKRAFESMFGVGPEYCERPLVDQPAGFLGGVTPRAFLEHMGTRAHEIAPMAMPLASREGITRILCANPSARIIVDGIRRITEAQMVRSLGGHIVRIDGRPIDTDKPCDLSQAEVEAQFTVCFSARIGELHCEVDRIVSRLSLGDDRLDRPGRRVDQV